MDILEERCARREGCAGSALLFIDIDNFKKVNDRLGHAMGDEAIRFVAGILKSHFRSCDCVCRYGGDEYCVLLNGIGKDALGFRLQELGQELHASWGNEDDEVQLTASIGCAYVLEGGAPPAAEKLLEAADTAMYEAKREGGDRYHVVEF